LGTSDIRDTEGPAGDAMNMRSIPKGETDFRLRVLILPFYLPAVFSSLGAGAVLPMLALFAREVGATVAQASFIVGLFGLGGLLFNIPAGALVTRFGRRTVMIAAIALEGTIAGVLGFSRSVSFLALFVFLLGAVHTTFFVTRLTWFRVLVPTRLRGRSLAIIGGENRLGMFFGPIAGGLVAETLGFHFVYWMYALLMFVSLACVAAWVPNDEGAGENRGRPPLLSRTGSILKSNARVFATAGVAIILLQILRTGRQALLPLIGESLGLSVSQVGLIVGIPYLMELILFYPTGIIMDRFGRKATAIPSLALLGLGIGFLPLAGSFASLSIVALMAGFGNGLASGINMTLSTDYAPREAPGEFIGVWRFVVDAGTTSGPFLVGTIAAALTLGGSALIVGALGLIGAAIFAVLVPEPLSHKTATDGNTAT
jgi:MFS family permease